MIYVTVWFKKKVFSNYTFKVYIWINNTDYGKAIDYVFIDFRKAFDLVYFINYHYTSFHITRLNFSPPIYRTESNLSRKATENRTS